MDADTWDRVGRALNPHRGIELYEMDRLYVHIPYGPAETIHRRLRAWDRERRGQPVPDPPPKAVFCGARGSGKSTQLRRLARLGTPDWEWLLLDLAQVLPDRTSTLQIVAQAGLALLARLVELQPDKSRSEVLASLAPARNLAAALKAFSEEVELEALVEAIGPIVIAGASAGPVAAVAAGAVVKVVSTFTAMRDRLAPAARFARVPKFMAPLEGQDLGAAQEVVRQVSLLAELLHERAERPVLLLMDGLDRTQRLEDVLAAFADVAILRDLSAGMVLTAPTNLRHDVRFAGLRQDVDSLVNYNAPVVDVDGRPRPEGIDPLRQLVQARLGSDVAVVADDALEIAARSSSGIPRECIKLVREAALLAEAAGAERVDAAHVEAAEKELRLNLQQALTARDITLLNRVLTTRRLGESERDQELLYENYVACYPNDDAYFRPHEVLVKWVGSESKRLEESDGLREPDGR